MHPPPLPRSPSTLFVSLGGWPWAKSGHHLASKTSNDRRTQSSTTTADHRQRPASHKLTHLWSGLAARVFVGLSIFFFYFAKQKIILTHFAAVSKGEQGKQTQAAQQGSDQGRTARHHIEAQTTGHSAGGQGTTTNHNQQQGSGPRGQTGTPKPQPAAEKQQRTTRPGGEQPATAGSTTGHRPAQQRQENTAQGSHEEVRPASRGQ